MMIRIDVLTPSGLYLIKGAEVPREYAEDIRRNGYTVRIR
jgi:hypothetical protein